MRERLCFSKTWNCSQRGSSTGADDHVGAAQLTNSPVGESRLQRSRSYEQSGSENKIRSRVPVIFQIHLVQACDHLALAVTDAGHIDREAIASHAKLLASARVGCDLRTVDDVFAWQARDVRARTANVFAVDHGDALALSSERPGSDGRARASTENHQIKV